MSFDFIAIDFETANNNFNSACSVGIVAVKDNVIIDRKYFLIQPPTLEFDDKNVMIHKITKSDVENSPKFPEVWEQIKHYFIDNLVVAHNAVFDMSVLKNCINEYNLEVPHFKYLCSIPISTRACRGEGIGQSLKTRAEHFGIELLDHHNALSDAETCANLVIKCIKLKKRKSIQSYCKVYSSLPIKPFVDLKPQTYLKIGSPSKFNKIVISEISATTDNFNINHPLFGKNIVFTGELKSLDRKIAMQKVVDLGAVVKSGVSAKTDFVVVGIQDKALVGASGISTKESKAYELKSKGHNIQVVNEQDFLKMLYI